MTESKDDSKWEILEKIMPQSKEVERELRPDLYGLVRRTIIKEREMASEATAIFRLDQPEMLRQLIENLPFYTQEEITRAIADLKLSPEDEELEASHWVFNHQAARGEVMDRDDLIRFKLVRLFEYAYLLICDENHAAVAQAFNRAFGRPFDAFSQNALHDEGHHWSVWAWFMHPDDTVNQRDKEKFNELWNRADRQ